MVLSVVLHAKYRSDATFTAVVDTKPLLYTNQVFPEHFAMFVLQGGIVVESLIKELYARHVASRVINHSTTVSYKPPTTHTELSNGCFANVGYVVCCEHVHALAVQIE